MMRLNTKFLISILLFSLGIATGVLFSTMTDYFKALSFNQTETADLSQVKYLMDVIQKSGYYFTSETRLDEGALRGMMESLGDPYSVYYSEEEINSYSSSVSSAYEGLGITFTQTASYPVVTQVINPSPAYKAGLRKGMAILQIDGKDLRGLSSGNIGTLLGGKVNETHKLLIKGKDAAEETVVTLTQMNVPTVYAQVFASGNQTIGYLKITEFYLYTDQEFLEAISGLESKNIDCLIIDVRNNPGGLVSVAGTILDYFLDSAKPYMTAVDRNNKSTPYYLHDNHRTIHYPIAILMNDKSASAAEIFAQAMNEIGGYDLIGTQTYGKGIMQEVMALEPAGSGYIKLTTMKWLCADGEWINGTGITPTVFVENHLPDKLSFISPDAEATFDDVSEDVRAMQVFLNSCEATSVRSDGYFDQVTVNALKAYQENRGLTGTGSLNPETAYQMNVDILNILSDKAHDIQFQAAVNRLIGQ